MSYLMSLEKAAKWILDDEELSPYDDPRYSHLAGNYDKNYLDILSFGICYGSESFLSTRYLVQPDDTWPLRLMYISVVTYPLYRFDVHDPYLQNEGWHKLLIGEDRTTICDSKGQPLYKTAETSAIPKEIPNDG